MAKIEFWYAGPNHQAFRSPGKSSPLEVTRTANTAFERIYRNVSRERKAQLLQFRTVHALKRLAVRGVEWQYIAAGTGTEAIMILGGGLSTAESSFRTITELEDRYRVLSPSYPPIGDLRLILEGLSRILAAEGLKRAHFYGHSLGSAVAHAFVRSRPNMVDKLVLSSFGLYTPQHTQAARIFIDQLSQMPEESIRAYYEKTITRLMSGAADDECAFMQAYFEDLLTLQLSKAALLARFAMLTDLFDNADRYAVFAPVARPGKVLIIEAKDDTGFDATEREQLKATYPEARVHTFESGGHWVGLTHSEEYDAALREFLQA